jgi:hypothetical protein
MQENTPLITIIKSAKLLAQSTGDFIRAELNDDVR